MDRPANRPAAPLLVGERGAGGDASANTAGFGCLHCVEQLHLLRPAYAQFAELGVDIVAIGSDTAPNIHQASLDLPAAERIPFPMLADPKLEAFKAWRCHDDV